LAGGGQLGGSQAGAHVSYDIGEQPGELQLYLRATSALHQPHGAEAALGVAVRPLRSLPVTLALERRQGLDQGGRNAWAAFAAGGFGPREVVRGIEAEGYAQAGVVGLRSRDLFADGKIALMHSLTAEPFRLEAGVAASGGAQPGVRRLDIGPQIQARLPWERGARVSAEWRQRIGGNAAPGSGITVTLAADF
jgi:hypothetical protein